METLLQDVASQKAGPVELGSYLSSAVSNVICSLLMSVRFRHDDPRFLRFTSLIDDGFRLFTVTAMAGFIPVLKLLPGFSYAFSKIRQVREPISRVVATRTHEHERLTRERRTCARSGASTRRSSTTTSRASTRTTSAT